METRGGSDLEHTYRVNICGESLQLRSDQPPQIIEQIAGYLDSKIREVSQNTMNGDKFRLVAMAALNLAEELINVRTRLEAYDSMNLRMQTQAKTLTESLNRALDPKG